MKTAATGHPSGPTLEPGVSLLHRPSARSVALHDLVVRTLNRTGGRTLWVDARNNASTYTLYDMAPDSRLLENIEVARAFTAYQHHSLVTKLVETCTGNTDLVVVPCTASLYEDDDLHDSEGLWLLDSSLEILHHLATTYDVPVLVTTAGVESEHEHHVSDRADRSLTAMETSQGIRYEGDGYETTVYWGDGFFQTTIPYWIDLFGCTCTESAATATTYSPRPFVEG